MTVTRTINGLKRRCPGSRIWLAAAALIVATGTNPALAHVSEQGLVLLLPTTFYMVSGVAAVVLTVFLVALLPEKYAARIFSRTALFSVAESKLATVTSLAALGLLMFLVYVGLNGSHDPLANPLPLFIWTVWWVGIVCLQAVFGNLWHWLNPWTGLYRLINAAPLLTLPAKVGVWPGIAAFLGFAAFALADLAPDDPARLARFVGGYWAYTFIGMLLFGGEQWLSRGDCFTLLLRNYSRLSPFSIEGNTLHFGVPGWRLVGGRMASVSGGVFILVVLASGSFDGLNETFWWLGKIGINPLEFPGRSAVVWSTLTGLLVGGILLPGIFAVTVFLGLLVVGEQAKLAEAFGRLSLAVLPIALAYHFSHYLSVLLVNGQYALAAATDPWAVGADYLGLGVFHVTTGFFNTSDTVKLIWLSQAVAVVAGHILAVLMSHAIAVDIFGNARKATLSQIPTALFMVGYTVFGLWLLASPRGL